MSYEVMDRSYVSFVARAHFSRMKELRGRGRAKLRTEGSLDLCMIMWANARRGRIFITRDIGKRRREEDSELRELRLHITKKLHFLSSFFCI